ncbi:4Fe-4S dicluster domain-containing protein [Desulfosarcina sp.]|uniref:4Fe-4S dicluster domain-containing protein n=1 Tax=Desulfosarcina sp. TaxID=2027861 RepID=UPI003970AC18
MRADIVDKVRAAGVVGAGGAGFPSHIKLQFEVTRVLANGASCEPLLAGDPYIMAHQTDRVLSGLLAVMDCTEAPGGTVCLKSKHAQSVAALEEKISANGYTGRIDVFELDDFYPAGDEFILVNEVMGKIVPEGGIPLNVQVVVSNVESLLNISRAMDGHPVTDRYVTVCGEVNQPIVCKVPIGMPVRAAIELAGGPKISDYGIVMGGPMMGRVLQNDSEPVVKTTSGILVLPSNHNVIRGKNRSLDQMRLIAKSACTQCSRCTELCPRYLIGHSLEPHRIMRHLAYTPGMAGEILEDALICCECGVCEKFACPMMLSPREINAAVKRKLLSEGVKREPSREVYQVSRFFNTRKIPLKRLMERLDVSTYDTHPPFYEDEIHIRQVSIPLQQHLGKPAEPVVQVGDKLKKGDLIGEIPKGALGARMHASIDGTVTSVGDHIIITQV